MSRSDENPKNILRNPLGPVSLFTALWEAMHSLWHGYKMAVTSTGLWGLTRCTPLLCRAIEMGAPATMPSLSCSNTEYPWDSLGGPTLRCLSEIWTLSHISWKSVTPPWSRSTQTNTPRLLAASRMSQKISTSVNSSIRMASTWARAERSNSRVRVRC